MLILALDVGTTTGYAFLSHGVLVAHGTLTLEEVNMTRGRRPWARFARPDYVVIERPILHEGVLRQDYAMAVAMQRHNFETAGAKVEVVRASDWKPRFKNAPLPGRGVLPTQHEKDAYRLALWAEDHLKGRTKG